MAGKVYFNNKQQVTTAFYNGILISKGYSNEIVTFDGNLVTLTINPTPSDAIITFSNYEIGEISSDSKSIRIKKGSNITYSVSKSGYVTQNNTITINNDQTLNIELQLNLVTLTINTTPSDATVTFSTGTVSGKTCTVSSGTLVSYTVSKQYYNSQTGSVTVTSNQTVNVTITSDYYIPEVNEVIVNLTGSSKYENNTLFVPGRYRVEVAPGRSGYSSTPVIDPGTETFISNMNHVETITQPFFIRAYCGSDGSSSSIGTNPYSGSFKVNGIPPDTRQNGIDVNHIFGAGGGNSHSHVAYLSDTPAPGGGNCLGNGTYFYDDLFKYTTYYGAGSCCHLLPDGGTFGTNYLRAYHCAPLSSNSGSAYGGAQGSCCTDVGGGYSWCYRGGNSPYGTGGSASFGGSVAPAGTGIGAGGKTVHGTISGYEGDFVVGAGAYYNGSQWIDEPGNLTNTGSSYIKITYLGQP